MSSRPARASRAVRAERAVADVTESGCPVRRERIRPGRPDENGDRSELVRLRDERFGERQRLARRLRDGDRVARPDEAREVERCRVELDGHQITFSARRRSMSASA